MLKKIYLIEQKILLVVPTSSSKFILRREPVLPCTGKDHSAQFLGGTRGYSNPSRTSRTTQAGLEIRLDLSPGIMKSWAIREAGASA